MERALAVTLGAGRLILGAGLLAAPAQVAAGWLGEESQRPATQELIRGLGARDLVLGAGLLGALRPDGNAASWLAAGVVADVADAFAAVLGGDAIPGRGRAATLALASVAAVTGALLIDRQD